MYNDGEGMGGGADTTHATTGWLVWKNEADLDYVRRHAQLL
jgi:hypothetical protein